VISTADTASREAKTSGKKKRSLSNVTLIRQHRLRPKRSAQSRVVETANRKVALIASAVVIAFLAAIALRTLLT
jgi:hypothetical protein